MFHTLYGRTMFRGIEHLPKILTSKMAKYISSDFPQFFSEGAYNHPIHPCQVVCRVLYWCWSYECLNFIFWSILVDFPKNFKFLTYNIKMTGYITSKFPQIFSEGAYDHPIHPYQIVCRVLYWFRSYEFFNLIFW